MTHRLQGNSKCMNAIIKYLKGLALFLLILIILWAVAANYSVIFSKDVQGEITGVERVEIPVALMQSAGANDINAKVFSFAIGIKDMKTGEIYTASSEDRQWAVAQKGQCAEAKFLPYPPWDLSKKDTFFGARLIKLYECPK